MVKDALGDRMKKYEYVTRTHLTPRTPVIIRVDGKAFHTFTRGFKKPFDDVLVKSMQQTMKYLCENIQGCVLGYQQSDEITLVLVDYRKIDTCSWFDYNVQKCASIVASMATMSFNKFFAQNVDSFCDKHMVEEVTERGFTMYFDTVENETQYGKYNSALSKGAMFDARVFNIPKEEVTNCILWRQNDATRNSIEMVGHANFSQSSLHKKSCNQIQDMLILEKGINWNDFPVSLKRGSCCIRKTVNGSDRMKWVIDDNIPIFKGEQRSYIDNLVFVGD